MARRPSARRSTASAPSPRDRRACSRASRGESSIHRREDLEGPHARQPRPCSPTRSSWPQHPEAALQQRIQSVGRVPSHRHQLVDVDVGNVQLQKSLRDTTNRARREVAVAVEELSLLEGPVDDRATPRPIATPTRPGVVARPPRPREGRRQQDGRCSPTAAAHRVRRGADRRGQRRATTPRPDRPCPARQNRRLRFRSCRPSTAGRCRSPSPLAPRQRIEPARCAANGFEASWSRARTIERTSLTVPAARAGSMAKPTVRVLRSSTSTCTPTRPRVRRPTRAKSRPTQRAQADPVRTHRVSPRDRSPSPIEPPTARAAIPIRRRGVAASCSTPPTRIDHGPACTPRVLTRWGSTATRVIPRFRSTGRRGRR